MPRRIEEDHKDFRDVYKGRIRKALKKYIKNGSIFRTRGDGKRIKITIPKIDIPHIVYGNNDEGIGRGEGKPGDVIGKDKPKGKGQGDQAGKDHQDGIDIGIEMEDVLKFLKDDLELPDLKPKPNEVHEDVKIKYNDISKKGPESLRHDKRTMLQAMKRMAASGELNKKHIIPGHSVPMQLITPINDDKRYRQWNEVKIPSSNAVIFFARDGSGSMGEEKCNIVSDMAWWIDLWIRQFYDRVERMYVWHDTQAEEVDEKKFYNYRYGGGTMCSSALNLISEQFENRYPPDKWNYYVIYFSDGDNWGNDNERFVKMLKEKFPPNIVNFVGIVQILCWHYEGSLKNYIDQNLSKLNNNVKTTSIGEENTPDMSSQTSWGFYGGAPLSDEERDKQIRKAIIDLLGKNKVQLKG